MNKQEILQYVDKKFEKKQPSEFRVGDTVRVLVRITEGDSTRVQAFEGIVIAFSGLGGARTFTVRKISFGVGVERSFPMSSPTLEKIEVVRSGYSRRAKLYYLRNRVGRSARLEEKDAASSGSTGTASASAAPAAAAKKSLDGKSSTPEQELVASEKK